MSKLIKLQSSDGDVIAVPQKCAKMSHTIKDMLDTIAYSEFDQENEIPLPNVSTSSLKKIVEWMIQWQDQPQPSSEEIKDKLAETIDAWNEDFLKMDLNELYDLITASNYLNIPGLLWLTTREVAYMIKGKSPDEIRQMFNIENDWTQMELEQVQKENQWCEEK